jgi:hypothetical protein
MRQAALHFGLLLLAGAATPTLAVNPASSSYAQKASVLDAGAADMASPSYRLSSSVGEPVAGVVSSGSSYKLASGFVSVVFVPVPQLSPAKLDFASQGVGTTSAAQSLQVTNLGAAPLVLSGFAIKGDFAQTNSCTAPIKGGTSCTLSVTYKPTLAGALTGTLTFNSNAPGAPIQVALTGTGAGAGPAGVLTLDVTKREVVAKGKTNRYTAAVGTGKTYVVSLTGILGEAQLQVFSDSAYKQPLTCLVPSNLANSTFSQPADCSFVGTGGTVYISVSATTYQAAASNRYDLRVSPRNEMAAANQGTQQAPVSLPLNRPYAGTVGAVRDNTSYYLVNSTGSGDLVISLTGLKADQRLDLFIYDNAAFSGWWLDPTNCHTGQFLSAPETCVLPAGRTYYLKVMNRSDVGGPFTLMAQ